jgi:signal transduction histidine kinase
MSCDNSKTHPKSSAVDPGFRQELAASQDTSRGLHDRLLAADRAIALAIADSVKPYAYHNKLKLVTDHYPDSTYSFLNKYHKLAADLKDSLNLVVANGMLAEHFLHTQQSDSALYYYEKSRAIHEVRKDSIQVVYALLQMAEIYRQYNDYGALENSTVEASRFLNDQNDTLYNPTIYNNFGIAAKNRASYSDAIKYYDRVENMTRDSIKKIIALSNVAVVYKMTGEYDRTQEILTKLLASKKVSSNPHVKGRLLAVLGQTYLRSDAGTAIAYLQESEKNRKMAADSIGLAGTWHYLAEAYSKTDLGKALSYEQKSYATATRSKSIDDRLEALKGLVSYSNSTDAKIYLATYIRLNDSISKVRQSARNQFAKIRYDATVEKQENQQLRADKIEKSLIIERSYYYNAALLLGIILLLSLGLSGYLILRRLNRKRIVQKGHETETRIGKKIHDEFANDIYSAIAFVESENLSNGNTKENLLQQLSSIYSRSRDISRENSTVATDDKFPDQLRRMLSEFNSHYCKVIISGISEIDWSDTSAECKITVYRVLHELIVNMKKHSNATLVGIRFEKFGSAIKVVYTDNGVGFDKDKCSYKNGLANVENRIHEISGTITFDSTPGKGLKILIVYPLRK